MILDEIRKLRFNHTSMESINSKGIAKVCYEPVVKLSDIEKLLEDVRCENCKQWQGSGKLGICNFFTAWTTNDFIDTKADFYCSQFERKP